MWSNPIWIWKLLMEENRKTGAFSYDKIHTHTHTHTEPSPPTSTMAWSWMCGLTQPWHFNFSASKTRWAGRASELLLRGCPEGLGNRGGADTLLPWAIFNVLYLMHYLPINFTHLKPGRFRNATCNRNQFPISQVRTEKMTEVWWYKDGSISQTEGNLRSYGNERGFQVAQR